MAGRLTMRGTILTLGVLLLAASAARPQAATPEDEVRKKLIKELIKAGGVKPAIGVGHSTFSGGFPTPGGGTFPGGGVRPPGGLPPGGPPRGGPGPGTPPLPPPLGGLIVPAPPLPKIDPKAAVKDLLPAAPEAKKTPVYLGTDLRKVPEVRFDARPGKELTHEEWFKRRGLSVAAGLHINAKERDGYMKALVKSRPDLAGLPLAMGDDCRTKGPFNASFKTLVEQLRPMLGNADQLTASFVTTRRTALAAHPDDTEKVDAHLTAHLRAVRQMAGPAAGDAALARVQYLASVQRADATRDLARIAVYSRSSKARKQAIEALSVRRERDYTPVLLEALKYPWPAVAANAAEAITKLERKDLMPRLVDMLEGADPRGPREEGDGEEKKYTASEMVRINHHHNCMLCHAPVDRAAAPADVLIAEMPLPTQPLQPPSTGYGSTQSPLLVRIDVTYIRQDFSAMMDSDEKSLWPASQRFDFVVRKRELTKEEAAELKKRVESKEAGVLTPYQKAAVKALREMTGRDFEPKAEAWRKFLKLKKEDA
jgi:hypothetical protein